MMSSIIKPEINHKASKQARTLRIGYDQDGATDSRTKTIGSGAGAGRRTKIATILASSDDQEGACGLAG